MSRSMLVFLLILICRLNLGITGDGGGDTDGGENANGRGDMGQLNTEFSGSARLLLWT